MALSIRHLAFGPLLAAIMAFSLAPEARAQDDAERFSPDQEQAIRELVREYLVNNPEVLVEALQIYQERQRTAAAEQQRLAVQAQQELLLNDEDSPEVGNPDGDVVVVEFFDYRCGYCRSVAGKLREAVKQDGGIRLIMKEFPILSTESRMAARAALAAARQDLYEEFHFALMQTPGQVNEAYVLKVAESVGLDVDQLKADMKDPEINVALRRTYDLARELSINGTPAFVIGDQVIPGAIDMDTLRGLVAEQRSKSS